MFSLFSSQSLPSPSFVPPFGFINDRQTETDRDRQRQTETGSDRQWQTGSDRQRERDRQRHRQTGLVCWCPAGLRETWLDREALPGTAAAAVLAASSAWWPAFRGNESVLMISLCLFLSLLFSPSLFSLLSLTPSPLSLFLSLFLSLRERRMKRRKAVSRHSVYKAQM